MPKIGGGNSNHQPLFTRSTKRNLNLLMLEDSNNCADSYCSTATTTPSSSNNSSYYNNGHTPKSGSIHYPFEEEILVISDGSLDHPSNHGSSLPFKPNTPSPSSSQRSSFYFPSSTTNTTTTTRDSNAFHPHKLSNGNKIHSASAPVLPAIVNADASSQGVNSQLQHSLYLRKQFLARCMSPSDSVHSPPSAGGGGNLHAQCASFSSSHNTSSALYDSLVCPKQRMKEKYKESFANELFRKVHL